MPTVTPIMPSSVPCDGAWHKIYSGTGNFAHVFVQYNGTTCTFTARLIDDPPGPPVVPPAPPVVKQEKVIPIAGGWRGFSAVFDHFEVKCEPPTGAEEPESDPRPQQEQGIPEIQASRKIEEPPVAALLECPFEWYMTV